MQVVLLILQLFNIMTLIQSYKILGVFAFCAHSHHKSGFRLLKELADRGHEVTMISCFPQKAPITNFRDVSVAETIEATNELISQLIDSKNFSYYRFLQLSLTVSQTYTRNFFKTKPVQDLLNSNETFDLVIMENMINDAMSIFSHRFKCPLVLFVPLRSSFYNHYLIGNPAPISFVPNILSEYGSTMNFWQRLENTYGQIISEIYLHFYQLPEQAKLLKEFFPDAPDLFTILYDVSIQLTTSHVSLTDSLPLQQNVKEIGGFHILPRKPLPKEIKFFLDNATEGVILFSMGSLVRSDNLEPKMRKGILKAFSKLKQKVIWKFETDLLDKPDNVLILDWLPQHDILAHPNVVAFITHGGMLSAIEAIYHGVPMLGIPVFFDQTKNIGDAVRQGCAIKISLDNLNEESLGNALNELINNQQYRKAAKERSKIMRDQPMKQIDEAVFWVEYAIRHKGAHHLKSTAVYLKWYQLYLVDIVLFVAVVLLIMFMIFWIIVKLCLGGKKYPDIKVKKN